MEIHEFKQPLPMASVRARCAHEGCGLPPSAECHNLLTEEEADLVVGAIPLQALLENDDENKTLKWLKKVYSMGVSEGSVVPQQNAGEMLAQLDELGFGKQEGRRGNTLWAMVMDAADEIEKLRANSQLVTALADALAYTIINAVANGADWSEDITNWAHRYRREHPQPFNISGGKLVRTATAMLNPPPTQLPLEHAGVKAEREDGL